MKKSAKHKPVKLLLQREIVALLSSKHLSNARGGVITLYSELVNCVPTSSDQASECC
jgi:hypothetical protein